MGYVQTASEYVTQAKKQEKPAKGFLGLLLQIEVYQQGWLPFLFLPALQTAGPQKHGDCPQNRSTCSSGDMIKVSQSGIIPGNVGRHDNSEFWVTANIANSICTVGLILP